MARAKNITPTLVERIQKLGPLKTVLLATAAFVVLVLVFALLRTSLDALTGMQGRGSFTQSYPGVPGGGTAYKNVAYESDAMEAPSAAPAPSMRNILPPDQRDTYVAGDDAEAFETRAYDAVIRTTSLDNVCDTVFGWKSAQYVVFEQQRRSDSACYALFKVERAHSDEILASLTALHPDELVANTETIKEQVIDYTSRLDILLRKQEVIESTLEQATKAYDDLVVLATEAEDVGTLAKVVDSKLQQIERLTQERISIASQIEQVGRQKAEALDKIEYAQFSVRVSKYQVVDWDTLTDSWVYALERFVHNINQTLQDMSIGLVANLLRIVLLLLYLFVLLVVGKYAWQQAQSFWRR